MRNLVVAGVFAIVALVMLGSSDIFITNTTGNHGVKHVA